MEAQGHLLALKVMRVSRPTISGIWEPFYSSSPSFSARSTASLASLQGAEPLPGHPKTLRDLSHMSDLLTLPAAFGAIQLGETFSCCLCVNNESTVVATGVVLRVEMQTATSKVLLVEHGGLDHRLTPGEMVETVVHHEIKELGQHVLACTISYRAPLSSTRNDPGVQSFRKFYKFGVTNPLSVKTKAHVPRSPSAQLSVSEREKVFLEVHIQNLTQDTMWFEHMYFEPVGGWRVLDGNVDKDDEGVFTGSMALMQPQDMRQYLYILAPAQPPDFPVTHPPGTIIALGRLDIKWRSSHGEPGRLLTSTLSRRIPLPAGVPLASAIPPHLQQRIGGTPPPIRPQSPLHTPQRSSIAAITPVSSQAPNALPYRARTPSMSSRPQSPGMSPGPGPSGGTPTLPTSPLPASTPVAQPLQIDVDVIVDDTARATYPVDKPFVLPCVLRVSGTAPASGSRLVKVAVQHLHPRRPAPAAAAGAPTAAASQPLQPATTTTAATTHVRSSTSTGTSTSTPRISHSGTSTPSPTATPQRGMFDYALAERKLLAASQMTLRSPEQHREGAEDQERTPQDDNRHDSDDYEMILDLPSPYAMPGERVVPAYGRNIAFLGPSVRIFSLSLVPRSAGAGDNPQEAPPKAHDRESAPDPLQSPNVANLGGIGGAGEVADVPALASEAFQLTLLPTKTGLVAAGGLRVILLEEVYDDDAPGGGLFGSGKARKRVEVRVLKEWDCMGEFWITSN